MVSLSVTLAIGGVNAYQTYLTRKQLKLQMGTLNRTSQKARTGVFIPWKYTYGPTVAMVLLAAASWIPYLFSRRIPDVEEGDISYIRGYGALAPVGSDLRNNPFLYVETKGGLFKSYRDNHYLAAVAFHLRGGDVVDAKNLQKNGSYDIKDELITLTIQLDQELLNSIGQGARVTNYTLLLVPNAVRMDQFETLRQAKALGVRIMQGRSGPP